MRMYIESLEHTLVCTPTKWSSPDAGPIVAVCSRWAAAPALLVSLGGPFLWSHLRMRPFTIAFPANRLRSWIFLLAHMVTSCQLGSV